MDWYAAPFLKAGASCYYANNWDDGVLIFLRRLFDGETSKRCFSYCNVDTIAPYTRDKRKEIGLCSSNFGGTQTRITYKNGVKTVKEVPSHKSFDVAWVGNPSFSIKELLK